MTDATETHADRMDRFYRFQRHAYDATRPLILPGRGAMVRGLSPPPGGTILEVGCGTASNLVRAGTLHRDARLHGVDVSRLMLETARRSVARHRLEARTQLREGDAATFDPLETFGVARFDRILFSYTLSMMPPWREALDHAAGMLAPGGGMHVVDFGAYEGLPQPLARLLRASGRPHGIAPRTDLHDVLADLAARTDMTLEASSRLRGYTYCATLRRRG